MSERFITLSDRDPKLANLLNGISEDPSLRPLLLQSNAEWTFEFVSVAGISKPAWPIVWMKALRPDSLVLSVAPILATLGWLNSWLGQHGESLRWGHVFLTVIGILALHASVNLFNDYHDHVRGWDRVREHGGARVIARGWLRALDVRRAAWGTFVIAVIAGAPVVFTNMSAGVLLALFVLLAALEFAVSRFGLKYRGFAEITAWFMFGPLLTGGFTWAMTGRLMWQSLVLGTVFGSMALLCLHLKNFERILVDGRAGLKTWTVRAGFDASKTFTYFVLGLILISMAFAVVLVDPSAVRLLPPVALAFSIGPLASRVHKLESPLSSRMHGLQRSALVMAWVNMAAFALGDLFRL